LFRDAVLADKVQDPAKLRGLLVDLIDKGEARTYALWTSAALRMPSHGATQ